MSLKRAEIGSSLRPIILLYPSKLLLGKLKTGCAIQDTTMYRLPIKKISPRSNKKTNVDHGYTRLSIRENCYEHHGALTGYGTR